MSKVTYEEAVEWLEWLNQVSEYGDREIIEYIKEVLWCDNDMRNS
jgi:hypothetical protein